MDFFISIYHLFLYQPIFNALVWFAEIVPGKDFGIAIILLTLVVRFLSYPLGAQAVRAQKKFADLQPKIKEVQEKYKDKKGEQSKAVLELYKEAKVNPLSTFLPLIIQIPVFIALYRIFAHGLQEEQFSLLYPFVQHPETVNSFFLGLLNLNEQSFAVALLAGVAQFVQLRQSSAKAKKKKKGEKPDIASMMQQQLPYIFPLLIVGVAARLPAAFGLYLITTTLFSIWQYWFIARREEAKEKEVV